MERLEIWFQIINGAKVDRGRIFQTWKPNIPHAIKRKGFTSKEKNAHINLVNSNGTIGALQASYKWSEGWSKANIFNEGSKSYLLMVKEKGLQVKAKCPC